ncbi:MAG: MazG nucleotide pyrophosphohydrolase domain-containing protein [Ktedonobacterales bacterium]|jgi:NTP pyrophosphatase (non-canonical NTP hydrolase)
MRDNSSDPGAPDDQPAHSTVPLSLTAAQAAVDASVRALGGYWPPLANLARLFEECGELARAINQLHGPKRLKAGEAPADLRGELGDTLYVLLVLANSLDLDAQDALAGALARAHERAAARQLPPPPAAP